MVSNGHRKERRAKVQFRQDDSLIDKLSAFFNRYSGLILVLIPIVTILLTFFTMLGWGMVTPQKSMVILQAEIDSTNNRLDQHLLEYDAEMAKVRRFVEALTVAECIDRTEAELLRMRIAAWCAVERGR